jgi:NMT1/THI5 like
MGEDRFRYRGLPGNSRHARALTAAVAASSLAVLAACSSSGGSSSAGSTTPASAPAAVSSVASAAAPASSAPAGSAPAASASAPASSAAASPVSSGSAPSKVPGLTVALGAVSAEAAALYVAQVEGYFTQQGVDVNIALQGAQASTNTVAGRADLAFTGAPSSLSAAVKGKQTEFVFPTIIGPGNASILVAANSKYTTLQSLGGQQVSTQGVSGASWGESHAISAYNASHGGKAFQFVPLGTSDLQADAVIAGRNAAAAGGPDLFGAQIAQGKLKVLIGPDSDVIKSLFPSDLVASGFWGLKSDIQSKNESITRWLAAMLEANNFINTHSVADLAQVMAKSPLYKGYTVDAVQTAVGFEKNFLTPTDGVISEAAWQDSLKTFGQWTLGFDLSSPAVSYASMIDPTLITNAKALVK